MRKSSKSGADVGVLYFANEDRGARPIRGMYAEVHIAYFAHHMSRRYMKSAIWFVRSAILTTTWSTASRGLAIPSINTDKCPRGIKTTVECGRKERISDLSNFLDIVAFYIAPNRILASVKIMLAGEILAREALHMRTHIRRGMDLSE